MWMVSITGEIQGEAEGLLESSLGQAGANLRIDLTQCVNSTQDYVEVIVRNIGTKNIDSGSWLLIVYNEDGTTNGTATNSSVPKIPINELKTIKFYKKSGDTWDMYPGEDYSIRITGPNGVKAEDTCTCINS